MKKRMMKTIKNSASESSAHSFTEYVAALENLLMASLELCNHIGTGWEAHGQSMEATMAQQAVREFRKAATHAQFLRVTSINSPEDRTSLLDELQTAGIIPAHDDSETGA
jgi:hypothetical protein